MLDVRGRPVLVVGGGRVAARKAEALVAEGALVTVIAPEVVPAIEALPVLVERRRYARGDAVGYRLVIAATGDPDVSEAVYEDAEAAGVWVNAADDPPHCSFFLTAVHRARPVVVSVSTEGASPALAGWLRDRIAAQLPQGLDDLARRLAAERAALHDAGQSTEGRDWRARLDAWENQVS